MSPDIDALVSTSYPKAKKKETIIEASTPPTITCMNRSATLSTYGMSLMTSRTGMRAKAAPMKKVRRTPHYGYAHVRDHGEYEEEEVHHHPGQGAPVVYNPLVRPNVNISIIGTSGAGKSFTSKIFLNRLIAKDPEIPFYVIDPEGEYTPLVEWLGGQVIHVKNFEGTGLGLDPLLLFEKGEAADAVCDIAGLTERKDISRVRDLVMSSRSLEELYQKLPQDLAEKFSSMRGGPESFIFQGEPLSFTPRMSFDMRGIESRLVKQLVSLLIFGKIWQIVSKPDVFGITRATPRLVLVDEVWLYMGIPSAATFLEKVARIGRKRNCILIINTQRPADMIGDPRAGGLSAATTAAAGRTILENSATKILMRQDEANRRIVGEAFGLSEQEMDTVVDLPQGEGILITETTHAHVQFMASSQEEYQLFTTKSSELV
ncbi:MAG: DUF87 domain-containing protein [Candidatus Verstraetearchaeota archaeon]|nr:DUF87 domain-containing protein [Candidatus Verstraetearchaeota archaeon]